MIVMFSEGSPHNRKPARTTSTEPTTKRIRSKPVPGQPPANVEYNRRNTHPSRHYKHVALPRRSETPERGGIVTL